MDDDNNLNNPAPAETTDGRLLQHKLEGMLKEDMALKNNNNLADASTDHLTKALLLRLLEEEEERRAEASSEETASDQQLIDIDTTKEKEKSAGKRRQKEDAAKPNIPMMSWLRGGIILLIMMVTFGSMMMMLSSPLSLIHQSDASKEGEAPPAKPPSALRSLRQKKHQSNIDNAESASPDIISPLPAVVPPPIFSPAAVTASNRRMKSDELRSSTCFDTPNWKDGSGDGCDAYEELGEYYDICSDAYYLAGDMGPATTQCCFCGGGSSTAPPTISPKPSSSPTKSAAPSSSLQPSTSPSTSKPSISPTKSATPSTSPSTSNSPTLSASPSTSLSNYPSIFPTKSTTPSSTPTITSFPTKSATPSSSFKPSTSPSNPPTISPKPSSSPSASSSPTQFCVDTPNWKDEYGDGCGWYEENAEDYSCTDADDFGGDMGPATEHCCICLGGIKIDTCDGFRSHCQDYFDVMGIEDGDMSPVSKKAESCSCGEHDVGTFTYDTGDRVIIGLHNGCKCDFWSRLCEDTGVGEACDYAAEYCCGDYGYTGLGFWYLSGPTCYCDFFNYARTEFGHSLKPRSMNIHVRFMSADFENPCRQFEEKWRTSPAVAPEEERTSLEAIYNFTNGPNWVNSDGWMNETVHHCQWYGISCNDDQYITGIHLRDNNLAGQFPVYTRSIDYWYNSQFKEWGGVWYEGKVYEFFGGGSFIEQPLEDFDFSDSVWQYTKYGLANLYYLETVDLGNNKLSGTIEYSPLYNLNSLSHFDVSGNQLSGEINALLTTLITHSDFSSNNFTSMHRFDKYKGSFQTLRYFNVSNNAIQTNATDLLENIPPNIEQLFAQNNQIYGSLPESMNLPRLRQFSMSNNALSGTLSESVSNLPQIQKFDISSNAFSGQFPDFAESFLTLQELDLSKQSNGFTGSILEDLAKYLSLQVLNVADNKLNGNIPPSIGNMAVVEVLDLSNNLLQSSIPPELGLLEGVLKRLDLSNNTLSGAIPSQIGRLEGASVFLSGNPFCNSSEIAPLSLCMLSSVDGFDLANDITLCPPQRNALSVFYDSAKGAEWTDRSNWTDEYMSYCEWKGVTCDNRNQVTELNLRNNGLSGRLSESIGNLTSMEVLDLSDNDIKGSIPSEIGLLSKLTYVRLSYNAFTGTAPEGLGKLTKLELLQLQSNRITEMPKISQIDETAFNYSAFVTDCGVPSAFEEAMKCEHCTVCCNANEDCYPQEDTRIADKFGLNYGTFAAVLFACLVAFSWAVVLILYFFRKRKNRGNALTMSSEEMLEKDVKYALSRIGKGSAYSYLVTDSHVGWLVAFITLGIQVVSLIFFVMASEANLQDDKTELQFTWKCPRDSDVCKDYSDLDKYGWAIFSLLMIAHLSKDLIGGSKLIYYSSKVRHSLGSRIRYYIGGVCLCLITLYALYVSTVYNKAIATSNTDIIVNSVIVLFVMDLDEWVFVTLEAWNENWTGHASDSKSSSDSEAKKEGAMEEMKKELALQKVQVASQQEELLSQKEELMIQKDQVERQNNEIAMLQETVQKLEAFLTVAPESVSQSPPNESVIAHTNELKDTSLERNAGKDNPVNEEEYPVIQNEFEESKVEVAAEGEDTATPGSDSVSECEGDKRRSCNATEFH